MLNTETYPERKQYLVENFLRKRLTSIAINYFLKNSISYVGEGFESSTEI